MIKLNFNYLLFLHFLNFTYLLKFYNIILFKFINNSFIFFKNKTTQIIHKNWIKYSSFNIFNLSYESIVKKNNIFIVYSNYIKTKSDINIKLKYNFFLKNKNSIILKYNNDKINNIYLLKKKSFLLTNLNTYHSSIYKKNIKLIKEIYNYKNLKKINKIKKKKKFINWRYLKLNYRKLKLKFLVKYFKNNILINKYNNKKKNFTKNNKFKLFKDSKNIQFKKLLIRFIYKKFLLKIYFLNYKKNSFFNLKLKKYISNVGFFKSKFYKKSYIYKKKDFKLNLFMNSNLSKIKKMTNFKLFFSFLNVTSYKMFFNIILFYPFVFINYLKKSTEMLNIFNLKPVNPKNRLYDDNIYFQSQFMDIGSFLEFLTKKNVNVNVIYNNFYDINNLFKLILSIWLFRIKHFYRTFNNSYDVALIIKLFYLSVKNKDIHLLMKIITDVTPLVEFKKQRRFFKFIIFMFRTYYSLIYNLYNIQGFQFEFRGKISVEGNPRTRKMYAKILRPSPSNYSYSTKYVYKTINTHTGVMGVKIWLYYKI